MKKKVSVELWRKYKKYFKWVVTNLKTKYNMDVEEAYSDTGSIFGYLYEYHFEKVEKMDEVVGVFEVTKFPKEKLPMPEYLKKELQEKKAKAVKDAGGKVLKK
jgi:hypothetical protein